MSEKTSDTPITIRQVVIPVVSGIVAVSAIISWVWIAATQFASVRDELALVRVEVSAQIAKTQSALEKQIDQIGHRLDMQEVKMADRWSGNDMKRWASDLGRLNPSLRVPDTQ